MISFQNVYKQFGTQVILNHASFTINYGERVGIVGPNGAGKSTILELMTSTLDPDQGEVLISGNLRLGHVRQQLNPHKTEGQLIEYTENAIPELRHVEKEIHLLEHDLSTGSASGTKALARLGELQTKFEQLGGYELRSRAEATLCGLGFPPERLEEPFRDFSGGWKIRAELARILVSQPDILLLDEPTNYLDVPAVEWLQDFLRNYPGTLILISHDRYLLNSLTKITLEVSGGIVTRYAGNYKKYTESREARHEQMLAAKANVDRKREKLERFVERFRSQATKASQAQSRVKQLAKLEDVEVPSIAVHAPKIILPEPPRCGAEVVTMEDASFAYQKNSWIFRHQSIRIERGDKAAVVGLNGMGKTTLLRILAGLLKTNEGNYRLGHNVTIGYQSQDFAETMNPVASVFDTARATAVDRSDNQVRDLLGNFGFPGDAIDKRVEVLSGGEKVRLGLARLLLQPCNFLVLDEPTTHLDIQARQALEEALAEYPGTLCLVSHDIEFVRAVATSIYEVSPQGILKYFGNYDYYREKKRSNAEQEKKSEQSSHATQKTPPPNDSDAPPVDRREQKREQARLRQEFSRLRKPLEIRIESAEERIDQLETERDAIHEELGSGGASTDFSGLNKRLGKIEKELAEQTENWEAASLKLEELRQQIGL